MILQQHYLGCLAQASYLIGDPETKTAVVVDPRRDVGLYLDEAEKHGLVIRHVLLTHFHADFLAGHLELRERCGATIHLGARAQAEFAFEEMRDGGTLEFGSVRLGFLETPGHTPESVCILVYDLEESEETPQAVLTGDTLFLGDVGRPDLLASVGLTSEELAGMLFDSLHEKLLPLPDETLVYPGHGAGSACGKNLSTDTVSTMGAQRATNYALQPMKREDFVHTLTANLAAAPAYFGYDAVLNRSEHRTLDEVLAETVRPLGIEELLRAQNAGAVVLDTRASDAFAAGHLRGSLNIGLDGKFASWAGTLIPTDASILLVTDPGAEEEAALRLGRIGFDRVQGYLEGGPETLAGAPEHVVQVERLGRDVLRERLDGEAPPRVVDVRTPTEWEDGHIEGAMHVPLPELPDRLDEIPADRDVVFVCKSGYRSSSATSLLLAAGNARVTDLVGGMDAWEGRESEAAACGI